MSESLWCRACAASRQTRQWQYGRAIPLFSRALTLAAILLLTGLLPWLSGRDPALALLRARSGEQEATAETLNAIRQSLGLDNGPLWLLGNWLKGLLHGDAGVSWVSGKPVMPGMVDAAGVSLTLMGCAAIVAFSLAVLLSARTLISGMKGHPVQPSGLLAAVFTTLPEFLLATCLLIVGAVWLNAFPPFGWQRAEHVVLPALALGLPAGGYMGRILADAFAGTFREHWLLTWSVAGVPRHQILFAVLMRTLPGVLPLISLVLVSMTGGAIAVEKVFAIPGLGGATLGAAAAQDVPALQAGVLILLLIAVTAGSLASALRLLMLRGILRNGDAPVPEISQASPSPCARGIALSCIAVLVLVLATGLTRDPYASELIRLQPPSLALPLGADAMGRDLLARVAHGTLNTCFMALWVALGCLGIGLLAGLFPRASTGPTEIANAMPPVIAGLVVAAINGPGTTGAALAILAVSWAPLAAHTAALVSEINARPYIRLLPVLGTGPIRRSLFYTLPALIGPLFRHAMLRVPGIALALASLGFLGLGSPPPLPEWGRVLAEGMPYVERAYWGVLAPALALIVLSILAVSASNITIRRHVKKRQ